MIKSIGLIVMLLGMLLSCVFLISAYRRKVLESIREYRRLAKAGYADKHKAEKFEDNILAKEAPNEKKKKKPRGMSLEALAQLKKIEEKKKHAEEFEEIEDTLDMEDESEINVPEESNSIQISEPVIEEEKIRGTEILYETVPEIEIEGIRVKSSRKRQTEILGGAARRGTEILTEASNGRYTEVLSENDAIRRNTEILQETRRNTEILRQTGRGTEILEDKEHD